MPFGSGARKGGLRSVRKAKSRVRGTRKRVGRAIKRSGFGRGRKRY